MSLKQTVRTKISDLYRSINEFKGFQPRSNLANYENYDLADSNNILNRWKNYLCDLYMALMMLAK
jgi:hypothetical protein